MALIAQREAMDSEVFNLESSLPGASVEGYQQMLELCRQRNGELRTVVDRYMGA